jgi:thymidylate kinase
MQGTPRGKLIVFEGIYGAGRLIVGLVELLRTALVKEGRTVYEIDSPDSGRAQVMGVGALDGSWRYGRFEPDFFFELAGRSRVAAVAHDHLGRGEVVLCKSFTLSSIAYAALKGHDWFREDLNVLEARARQVKGGEVRPDLTILVDVTPETAASELGKSLAPHFTPADLVAQRHILQEEVSKLPSGTSLVISGARSPEALLPETLAAIRAVL